MRTTLLLLACAALCSCENEDYCEFTEGTGLFESFKKSGCLSVDVSLGEQDAAQVILTRNDNTILLDGIDSLGVTLRGHLYVGRQGTCFLSDSDSSTYENQMGHCDYMIRKATKISDKESRYDVEILDAYMSWKGKQGTFKARFNAQAFDQGFGN